MIIEQEKRPIEDRINKRTGRTFIMERQPENHKMRACFSQKTNKKIRQTKF